MALARDAAGPQAPAKIVSLGETETPLVALARFGKPARLADLLVKDEGRLPTGSFKARGLAMAVAMAKALGVARIAMPTNGNAGAALAAYASRAGIETIVFCPADTPEINVREIGAQGARVYRVNGLIDECGAIVGEGAAAGRLVRLLDAEGAVPDRGQEDDGATSSPSSSAGSCPTRSSIRPAAAPA